MKAKDAGFWVGIAVLAVVAVALVWYMATHPAPARAPAQGSSTASSTSTSINENEQYYTIDASYPSTTPLATTAGAQQDQAARAVMAVFVNTTIAQFKQQNIDTLTPTDIQVQQLGQDGRQYALDIEYSATSSPATTSYVFTVFEDTMGAHPNGTYQTYTFDNASGDQLALGDLFQPGSDYLAELSSMARSSLPQTIASGEDTDTSQVNTGMIQDGTQPTAANFSNFYLSNGQLVLIFPPYQVGPYALGTVLFPIPTAQLKSIMKPAYQ